VSMPAAWTIHTIALWAGHLPLFYDAAVNQPVLHAAQHTSMVGTALLFWWPALERRASCRVAASTLSPREGTRSLGRAALSV
jgi:cytochrome c oxidase assembly factor CtaG